MAEKLEILIKATDQASSVLKNVEKGLKDAGSPAIQSGLNGAGGALGAIGTIGKALLAGGVLTTIATQLKGTIDATMQWGQAVDTLGDMFGMSGTQASTWSVAMQHVGLSVQEGGMQLNYFTRMLAEANEKMAAGEATPFSRALDKLGVAAQDSGGKLKSFDDLMPEIMDAFQKLPAGVEATSVAMELFGARGGSKFLDFLRQGSAGLQDADAKARAFGLSMDTIDANRVEELGFKLNDLGMRFEGLKVSIGLGLIGPLESALGLLDQLSASVAANRYEYVYDPTLGEAVLKERPETPGGGNPFTGTPAIPGMGYADFGDPNARWGGMNTWAKGSAAKDALGREYTALLRSMMGGEAGGGASSFGGGMGGAGGASSLNDLMAMAFPDMGAAMGWQGAFASQHGGRGPGMTDLRDRQASLLFQQKYGKGPSDEDWQKRYYSGSFEGVDEKGAGLDALFGKPGTWDTLISEQMKADQKQTEELAAAFAKVMKGPIPVSIVNLAPSGDGSNSIAGEHSSTSSAKARM